MLFLRLAVSSSSLALLALLAVLLLLVGAVERVDAASAVVGGGGGGAGDDGGALDKDTLLSAEEHARLHEHDGGDAGGGGGHNHGDGGGDAGDAHGAEVLERELERARLAEEAEGGSRASLGGGGAPDAALEDDNPFREHYHHSESEEGGANNGDEAAARGGDRENPDGASSSRLVDIEGEGSPLSPSFSRDLEAELDLGESSRDWPMWKPPTRPAELVVAVLNAGGGASSSLRSNETVDTEEERPWVDLLVKQLQTQLPPTPHDLIVMSDLAGFRPDRDGAVEFPLAAFPDASVWDRMSTNKLCVGGVTREEWAQSRRWLEVGQVLLRSFPRARQFLLVEGDAVLEDSAKLRKSIDFAGAASASLKSLAYWDGCGNAEADGNAHRLGSHFHLRLFRKNPCSMVAALFPRAKFRLLVDTLSDLLFQQPLEAVHEASDTLDLTVMNGDVFSHSDKRGGAGETAKCFSRSRRHTDGGHRK